MATKTIDFRVNRDLLDSQFNGYKLSLEGVNILEEPLYVPVDRALPSGEQYSFLHAKLYGLHNHLINDSFNDDDVVYFVDKNWNVQKAQIDDVNKLVQVCAIPKRTERKLGDYNISFQFVSHSLAVVSDGCGWLHVFQTGNRKNNDSWKILFSNEVIKKTTPFVINDAILQEHVLHCLLFRIEQDTNEKYFPVLDWLKLSFDATSWEIAEIRQLRGKGNITYSHFAPDASAIYIVSENGFKFKTAIEENSEQILKKYVWLQSNEDISLKLKLPNGFEKSAVQVNVSTNELNVKYEEKVLLSGQLSNQVDENLTAWTSENDLLEIILTKKESGLRWLQLLINDNNGEEIFDLPLVNEIHEKLAKFCSANEVTTQECGHGTTMNSQQTEECDFEDENLSIFERLSYATRAITHQANLGGDHVLFTVKLFPDLPPAMAIKHDVDACLWQPVGIEDNFNLKHEGTLLAFAYVQASKQQKKFSACAPDLSYSVVCESKHHLFIYRQNKSVTGGELKNRLTGKRVGTIAQQQVVSLPNDEILGLCAFNSILYVLTETNVMALKL